MDSRVVLVIMTMDLGDPPFLTLMVPSHHKEHQPERIASPGGLGEDHGERVSCPSSRIALIQP